MSKSAHAENLFSSMHTLAKMHAANAATARKISFELTARLIDPAPFGFGDYLQKLEIFSDFGD